MPWSSSSKPDGSMQTLVIGEWRVPSENTKSDTTWKVYLSHSRYASPGHYML